jgi:hypothetical protein
MTREIKFRAWDAGRKEWNKGLAIGLNGDVIGWSDGGVNITLQQFTGLRDRKGIEIYEGDIVDSTELWHREPVVYAVKYLDGAFTVPIPSEDCEVIGNIYENPELLK